MKKVVRDVVIEQVMQIKQLVYHPSSFLTELQSQQQQC